MIVTNGGSVSLRLAFQLELERQMTSPIFQVHLALEVLTPLLLAAPRIAPVPLRADDSRSELLLLSPPLMLFALPLLSLVLWLLFRSRVLPSPPLAAPAPPVAGARERTADPPLPERDERVCVGLA